LAKVAGFSLHAATVCEAYQRRRLERLCRYITRPPIATKRLSVDGRGRVVYQYIQPFRDGLRFQPVDATHWSNRSAGVSKSNVSLGRSFSRLATAFNRFW